MGLYDNPLFKIVQFLLHVTVALFLYGVGEKKFSLPKLEG